MPYTSGQLRVLGNALPKGARDVRAQAALGLMRGVNDLDTNLSVEQHIAERLIFQQPWWKPWVSRRSVQDVVDLVNTTMSAIADGHGLPVSAPRLAGKNLSSEVAPLEQILLGIVLALIGGPRFFLSTTSMNSATPPTASRSAGQSSRARWLGIHAQAW